MVRCIWFSAVFGLMFIASVLVTISDIIEDSIVYIIVLLICAVGMLISVAGWGISAWQYVSKKGGDKDVVLPKKVQRSV